MTAERLAQLRRFAHYVAYHVPTAELVMGLNDADAGDDMLELCDATAAASELLNAARLAVTAIGGTRDDFGLKLELEKAYLALRAAIAKAEGRK